jgi:glycogen operon protein
VGDSLSQKLQQYQYTFLCDKKEFVDPYVKAVTGRGEFGHKANARGSFCFTNFDWSGEQHHKIEFKEMIMYQCHVRGLTKHTSSGVENPGTFSGVVEKIPYFKKLGINTLLFLPLYDFNEITEDVSGRKKCNYWGYTKDSFYFAPKQSYAGKGLSPVLEMKKMVYALHKNGLNLFMDMHFEGKTPDFILECLRYYVMEYHVDGFLLNQNIVCQALVENDPILRNVKLLGTSWDSPKENGPARLAEFNDGFLVDARRLLKSDEGQVPGFYSRFKRQNQGVAIVNYITQKNGFTLRDMVSFDVKHNEPNGEKNIDGTDFNYSWNCGAEGSTRRKTVLARRIRQQKNAFAMLLLSLGTPMILAGDEFGNTQRGNNNAYCQDNTTTWLDWNLLDKNKELFEFVRKLLAFRRETPVYHTGDLQGVDYMGYGAPDISCHGILPWVTNFVNYTRELGVLFYGSYFPEGDKKQGKSLYIAFNLHWESHEFFLPAVDKNAKWKVIADTRQEEIEKNWNKDQTAYVVGPRSVVVFEHLPEPPKPKSRDSRR